MTSFNKSQISSLAEALGLSADATEATVLATAAEMGINPADVVAPPRAILKDQTGFKMRIAKSEVRTADRGKKAGQAQINLRIAPVDANGKVVKKGTSFLTLALPFDTEGFKFDAKSRESAYRDFVTVYGLTPAGKALKQINAVRVGDTTQFLDPKGNPLKGPAYEAAQVKERIGFTKAARDLFTSEDAAALEGIEFYTVTNHSEYQGKTNVWFQNISAQPLNDKTYELVAGKMMVTPEGGGSDVADEEVAY